MKSVSPATSKARWTRRKGAVVVLFAAAVIVALAVSGLRGSSLAAAPATPDPALPALDSTIDRDAAIATVRHLTQVGRVDRIDAKLMTYAEYLGGAGPVRTHLGDPAAPALTGFGMTGDPAARVLWVVAISGEVYPAGRMPVFFGGSGHPDATPYPPYRWATVLIDGVSGQWLVFGDAGIVDSWPPTFDSLPFHPVRR
jgi:hypothetical protein